MSALPVGCSFIALLKEDFKFNHVVKIYCHAKLNTSKFFLGLPVYPFNEQIRQYDPIT
uniref:Uncharacterized protein n=1 Tax=Setaria viridis TaxID=4556 RepID=A0A4V6DBL9_SETVI|nr:hypothetical protein SEVIR_2G312366v2 [Setaria viridis]